MPVKFAPWLPSRYEDFLRVLADGAIGAPGIQGEGELTGGTGSHDLGIVQGIDCDSGHGVSAPAKIR
jgi:hypothetical protein